MESSQLTTASTTKIKQFYSSPSSSPPSSPPSLPTYPPVVISPCAACKILRRRCIDKCILAPYFPPTEPLKFTTAHRVFGASNIIKSLQELPESQRADAVSSLVYEANARIRDPVYGSAGVICQLQKQVTELQTQLARTQAELVNMQAEQEHLITLICMGVAPSQQECISPHATDHSLTANAYMFQNEAFFHDESNLVSILEEPLWT